MTASLCGEVVPPSHCTSTRMIVHANMAIEGHQGGPFMTPDVHLGPVMLAKHWDWIVKANGAIELQPDK